VVCDSFSTGIIVSAEYLPGNSLGSALIHAVVERLALVLAGLAKGDRRQAKTTEQKERTT
jgi:hypothetical protein